MGKVRLRWAKLPYILYTHTHRGLFLPPRTLTCSFSASPRGRAAVKGRHTAVLRLGYVGRGAASWSCVLGALFRRARGGRRLQRAVKKRHADAGVGVTAASPFDRCSERARREHGLCGSHPASSLPPIPPHRTASPALLQPFLDGARPPPDLPFYTLPRWPCCACTPVFFSRDVLQATEPSSSRYTRGGKRPWSSRRPGNLFFFLIAYPLAHHWPIIGVV